MIKISVILPVYNSQDYLEKTIESILNQTFSNFELIVVNDGSTDDSDKICEKYSKNKNVKYFYKSNSGVSDTRNYAIQKASGKYITFIDSDDLYEKDYLQTLYNTIREYDADLVSCGYMNFAKNASAVSIGDILVTDNVCTYIEKLQPAVLFNQIWNKIYKSQIIKDNMIQFDKGVSFGEDARFNLNYVKYCKKLVFIPDVLYWYRISMNGLGYSYKSNTESLRLYLVNELLNVYKSKNSKNDDYVKKSFAIQYFAIFSDIIDKRSLDSKKEKKSKIRKILFSANYCFNLKYIKESNNIKIKILGMLLSLRNVNFIYLVGFLANKYNFYNKKKIFAVLENSE